MRELEAVATAAGRGVLRRVVLRSPFIELVGDMSTFESSLPGQFRKRLRRRTRRLEEQGAVTVSFDVGNERLDELLAEGFAIESSGWKAELGTAIVSDPKLERFYRHVAQWAADRGWLRIGMLRLDGTAVAFNLYVVFGGTLSSLKGGFDTAYRPFAPGAILTRASIEFAYESGLRRYDFLGDADPYKLDWARDVAERVRIQAFARTVPGRLAHAAWRYGRPAVQSVTAARRRASHRKVAE